MIQICYEPGYLSRYSDELDGRGSIPERGKIFFSSSQRADLLWRSPTSYRIGTGGFFTGFKAAEA
jgi:hypothetical protein